jgi:hypothetical protein
MREISDSVGVLMSGVPGELQWIISRKRDTIVIH